MVHGLVQQGAAGRASQVEASCAPGCSQRGARLPRPRPSLAARLAGAAVQRPVGQRRRSRQKRAQDSDHLAVRKPHAVVPQDDVALGDAAGAEAAAQGAADESEGAVVGYQVWGAVARV